MTGDKTPLQDAIDRIGESGDHVDVGAGRGHDGKTQVDVSGFKDVGKPGGWSLGGAVQWVKDKGTSWRGAVRWRPRSKESR